MRKVYVIILCVLYFVCTQYLFGDDLNVKITYPNESLYIKAFARRSLDTLYNQVHLLVNVKNISTDTIFMYPQYVKDADNCVILYWNEYAFTKTPGYWTIVKPYQELIALAPEKEIVYYYTFDNVGESGKDLFKRWTKKENDPLSCSIEYFKMVGGEFKPFISLTPCIFTKTKHSDTISTIKNSPSIENHLFYNQHVQFFLKNKKEVEQEIKQQKELKTLEEEEIKQLEKAVKT